MYQFTSLFAKLLAVAQRVAADANTVGVDLSAIHGNALFHLNASAVEGAGNTATFKLQHSDTLNGVYTDTAVVFDQVTSAGPSFQEKLLAKDGFKRFIRVAVDVTGTNAAVTFGLTVIGKKHA